MTINCPKELPKKKSSWYVFLAGPIQGAPDWQNNMPEMKDVVWLSPRRKSYNDFNKEEQIEWETKCMTLADIILFWIPKEAEHIEGRQYAQTTRTEFGEYLALGKKIITAIDPSIPGRYYLEMKAKQYHQELPSSSLEEALSKLEKYINAESASTNKFFTADTHFGSQRALELSKRPYETVNDMDRAMIRNWNKVVHPNDIVYHLGDLGETWPVQYLNGKIILVFGNYERKELEKDPNLIETLKNSGIDEVYTDPITFDDYILAHEPLLAKESNNQNKKTVFCLFGHIHGRQKVKKFGIDVGVDANNFTPMKLSDVEFFRNAIEQGYYDEEVWSR